MANALPAKWTGKGYHAFKSAPAMTGEKSLQVSLFQAIQAQRTGH
jgi:hypothetical protein